MPDRPRIGYIEGDGIGPDIWNATRRVTDAAILAAYPGNREILWTEAVVGEKSYAKSGEWLPERSLQLLRDLSVSIKGPLTTPVGKGFRSLNVTIRHELDLYACVRPVRWYEGVPNPMRHPEDVNVVIFRENMEDTYAGIEWAAKSPQAEEVAAYLSKSFGISIPQESGIGVKFMSRHGTERIVSRAVEYTLSHGRKKLTVVHKGNIMKYTEGAFKEWAYGLIREKYAGACAIEEDLLPGEGPGERIVVNDRIADNMFQQLLLRSSEYDILVMPNLNGDYMSDAAAAQVGGLGMAPGANIGDYAAVFEATHGSVPKYAGMDKANPCSLMLSAVMMLDFIGWGEAARLIERSIEKTIRDGVVTGDLARQVEGAREVSTSAFAAEVIANLKP